MMKAKKLLILTTGGTIDKVYEESDGSLKNTECSPTEELLKQLRHPHTDIEVRSILAKDSLDMTDADRDAILQAIRKEEGQFDGVVVIHGTDTMAVSAKYCWERLGPVEVPVVFTGAMKPLEYKGTDALQNVAEAMIAAKILHYGVYICFHGNIYEAPWARKNKQKGTFEYFYPAD